MSELDQDSLLANVLRKFVLSDNTYAEWEPGSLTLDGHIGKRMTDNENAALRRLFEARAQLRTNADGTPGQPHNA